MNESEFNSGLARLMHSFPRSRYEVDTLYALQNHLMERKYVPSREVLKESPNRPEPVRVSARQIHSELYQAADVALMEPELTPEEEVMIDERVAALIAMGFTAQQEVADFRRKEREVKNIRSTNESKKQSHRIAIHYAMRYPNYKFITEEAFLGVIKNYELEDKPTKEFIGKIPDKNVQDMLAFTRIKLHEDDKPEDGYCIAATADEFVQPLIAGAWGGVLSKEAFRRWLVEDPILTKKVKHGRLIVTAWGDEASDPAVVNERMN